MAKRRTDPAHTHDAAAERAILGAILLDGVDALACVRAAGGLPVAAIYVEEHARILAAVYAIEERGEHVDAITVGAECERAGWRPSLADLAQMQADCPAAEAVGAYVQIVREHAASRGIRLAMRRAGIDAAEGDPAQAAARLIAELADVEAPAPVTLPEGYHVGEDGSLWADGHGETPARRICPVVPRIVRRGVDVATHEHTVTLRWRADGRDHEHTCTRATIAVSRSITSLADVGFPVTSNTAGSLVNYLAAAEELSVAPPVRMARACGWYDGAFLRGVHRHGPECPEWMRGDGVDGVIDSIRERGSIDEWSAAVLSACQSHPVIRLLVATSAAPPLLGLLGEHAKSWVVDLCGDAGSGKTSALRVAASVWGAPVDLQQDWSATRVGIERLCSALSGIPVLLDDTKKASSHRFASDVVFDVVSGKGKTRGTIKGMARPASFRSVLISTGEGPLAGGDASAGGSRRRTLQIDLPPWGSKSAELGAYVRRLEMTCTRHYGHAGRLLIDRLVGHDEAQREAMRDRQAVLADHYSETLARMVEDKGAPVDAVAQYCATIHLAGEELAAALGWPALEWLTPAVLRRIARGVAEVDRATAALEHALSWLAGNPSRTMGREDDREGRPVQPSAGYIGYHVGQRLAFAPVPLDTELRRAGYDAAAAVAAWHDRGWLVCDPGRRTRRVTYQRVTMAMTEIHPDAVAKAGLADAPKANDDTGSLYT